MNNKELYLFNSVKSIQYLKSFRPSSTPFNEFSSPGLSNVKIHSFLVQSHFNSSNLVYQKHTKEENKKTEFVQEGKGVDEKELFKPILVERTLLDGDDEIPDSNKNIQPQAGTSKRKSDSKNSKPSKKSRISFKIVD